MSRTEIAKTLNASGVTDRIESWADRLERLQELQTEISTSLESLALQKAATADELATALMPVAEAMARLTEETRQTLTRIVSQSQQGHKAALEAAQASSKAAQQVARDLNTSMLKVDHQVTRLLEVIPEMSRQKPINPWFPVLIASAIPTIAMLWLVWKIGILKM